MSAPKAKWISFYLATKQKPKTKVFDVVKNDAPKTDDDWELGHELGQVKWYSPWRRYSFFPESGTLFETQCLRDIAAFLERLMAERKREPTPEGENGERG